MRTRLLASVSMVLTAVVTSGQASHAQAGRPDAPPPAFRASVQLIVQTVSVKDAQGKPVEGLTAKDFVVIEDGKPQQIAFVEYQPLNTVPAAPSRTIDRDAPPAVVPSVTREGVTVPLPGDVRYRGRRLLVLYFDLYNMSFFDQLRLYDSANTYISTRMTSADMVAISVFQGGAVRLKLGFTDDRAALHSAVEELMAAADDARNGIAEDLGGAFGEDDDTFNIFATDRQLSALQTAVTDLGPLPEVKTLVYLGSGLRLNGTDNQAQLRATVNAAVRANVTINPIDVRGLIATAPMGDATQASPGGMGMFSGTIAQAATTRMQAAQDTLYALAKDTGGRAMFDNNDLALGMAQAADAVTGYYTIGYYTTNTATDGRYRRMQVSLMGDRAATLSYRQGYYGDKVFAKFTTADKERQLEDALRLENPITDIPMAMAVNYFQLNRAEYFVPVSLRMPGRELVRPPANGTTRAQMDVIGEVKDDHGVTIQNTKDQIQIKLDAATASQVARRPIQYETGFTLLPGGYVIKMLARDATTGRIGTFEQSFTIPNLEREDKQLPISSVVLTSQRATISDVLYTVQQKIPADAANPLVFDGQKLIPSVTRTFRIGEPVFVFLQAYEHGASAMRPLVAFVTFVRGGAKSLETEPMSITAGWNSRSGAVPIRFTISLGTLSPGSYECQVTVLDPDGGRAAFWREPVELVQ